MNKNSHFLKTSDEHTANLLRGVGFQELAKEGSYWVFINDNKIVFSSDDKKIHYTDKLTF